MRIQRFAAAETYIGLVEVGVGVIPAGGGTKEFALRASDGYYNGDVQIPSLQERFFKYRDGQSCHFGTRRIQLGNVERWC